MVIANPTASSRVYFLLDTRSVSQFKYRQAFSTSIGEFTYRRTYSRCDDGVQENWYDTVLRVVNGCYTLQYRHHIDNNIAWDEAEKQAEAAEMFERIFLFKFTPPGRGLWIMGTDALLEKGLGAALMNCSFVSTKPYGHKPSAAFGFAMDMLMLGVGVGFDVFGVGTKLIDPTGFTEIYLIPDTREGWVESVMLLIDSYTISDKPIHFNYSLLRPKGALIKTFGGKASGAEPLIELHEMIRERLSRSAKRVGHMTITDVNDIMTYIARCVVSGNVRRSAMLSLGPSDSTEFTHLKHPELYPVELQTHRWASNNSIVAEPGQNYDHITNLIMQNGEPGLIWLENVRNFGRYADGPDTSDWRAAGVNPCVPAGTRILTSHGYKPIEQITNTEVKIWNGVQWSTVTPTITGTNQPLVKVTFSDGTDLICTDYHKFILADNERIEAINLQIGDPLYKHTMPVVEYGSEFENAYTHGFYCGDGQGTDRKGILLYGEKKELASHLHGSVSPFEDNYGRLWVGLPKSLPEKYEVPFSANIVGRLEWLAGLLDADGCVLQNPNSVHIQLSSNNLKFLKDIRLMLTTLGVQAKISKGRDEGYRELPNHVDGTSLYLCKADYRLIINAVDTYNLVRLGLKTYRLILPERKPQRDARRFVTVVNIERLGNADVVYCFNDPMNHSGTFEGIVTANCGEQPLESYEACNLVECYPFHHDSYEDFKRTLMFAHIYGKSVALMGNHWPVSHEVMMRNRRIGIGQSGIQQFIAKHGIAEWIEWSDKGYKHLQNLDRWLSSEWSVPKSIRLTTVKPSGTVSILGNATPGLHYPVADRFYIRRIRVSDNEAELLNPLLAAGYPVEKDFYSPNTFVAEFPCDAGVDVPSEANVPLATQMDMAALAQTFWSDNAVSYTAKFYESEADQIAPLLRRYDKKLKGMSFLKQGGVTYVQQPYQGITEEEYKLRLNALKPIQWTGQTQAKGEMYCSNDSCSIM